MKIDILKIMDIIVTNRMAIGSRVLKSIVLQILKSKLFTSFSRSGTEL